MRGNYGAILEGLNEAKSTDGLPCFKNKNSSDRLSSDISFAMESKMPKAITDELGRVQVLTEIGMNLPSKEINTLEIEFAFDKTKDQDLAVSLIMAEMKQFLSAAKCQPRKYRPGYVHVAGMGITPDRAIPFLKALESVYGLNLGDYFTKASLKNF